MPLKEEFERSGNKLFRWRSYLPLLVLPLVVISILPPGKDSPVADLWDVFCLLISITGLAVRILTVGYVPAGTSGRNTRKQKAEKLNTGGMYSIVRHPVYLGNSLIWLGMVMFSKSLWCIGVSLLIFWLYYERIMFAEEEFLRRKFKNLYLEWAERTPAFIPKFKNWRSPDLEFSVKSVISREYTTLFVISLYYVFMESFEDIVQNGVFEMETFWQVVLVGVSLFYFSIRLVKKKGSILKETGR